MANYNRNWRNYNRREYYPEWEEYSNPYNESRGSRNRGNMIYGQDYGFQNPEADERGRVHREEENDRDFNYNRDRYNRYSDWDDEYEDQRSKYSGRTNYAYGGPGRSRWGAYDEDYELYPRGKYRRREHERSYNPHDRSWWDRAGDEVSSWFGDEDAERRRDMDRRYGAHRGKGPRGYKRSDERILDDINDRLSDDPFLDASNIEISVDNREVILTGTVGDRVSKRRAEDIVESVSGVTHIENRLRVTQNIPQERSVQEGSTAEKSRNNKYDEIQV